VGSGTGTGTGPRSGPGPETGTGTGKGEFPPPGPGTPPPVTTGGMKGARPDGGSVVAGGPPPMATGGVKGAGSDGGSVAVGGPPPTATGGIKGVACDGGSVGVSKTLGVGSSGDVFPGTTSDNTLAHRVLVKVVPSVINFSLLATFNLFSSRRSRRPSDTKHESPRLLWLRLFLLCPV
jgi:hypothetical protein